MLTIGSRATASLTVSKGDLASTLAQDHDDGFPEVLATARMVGLMELAASRLLRPLLKPGELSVGVVIDVRHMAATAVGETVEAEARYLGMEGRLHRFDISARDRGGEIGRGTHQRAIVEKARLEAGAHKRAQA